MQATRTIWTLALSLVAALAFAGSARALEADPWNQEDATKLTTELRSVVKDLIQTAEVEERGAGLTPLTIENYLLVEDLKQLNRYVTVLMSNLKKGKGRDDTVSLHKRIQSIVRDLAEKRRNSPLLTGSQPEIDKARDIFAELSAYYEAPTAPVGEGGTEDAQ